MTSVAVVVLDTLRKDYFDVYFDWLPGRRFERAYSTANWTSPAHASLFTGRYPSETGVHAKARRFDVPGPVLPERLEMAGYRTRCWTANPNLARRYDWHRGFEEFVGAAELVTRGDSVDWEAVGAKYGDWGRLRYPAAILECFRSDHETVTSLRQGLRYARGGIQALKTVSDDGASAVLERLRGTSFGDDEFLFVNLMEAHTPYFPPEPYRRTDEPVTVTIAHSLGLDTPESERDVSAAYEGSVAYLSAVYERIFEELHESFDYVVTLADHGEMLGEHGIWNHTAGLFPQVTHVPCVISGHGLDEKTDTVTSLVDVHRTLSDLCDVSAEDSRGHNLLDDDETREDPVFAEYHGLIPVAVRRLRDRGLDPRDLARHDHPAGAVAASPTYYGYEYLEEFREEGTTRLAAKRRLADRDISTGDALGRGDDTDSDPNRPPVDEHHLEQLGYL